MQYEQLSHLFPLSTLSPCWKHYHLYQQRVAYSSLPRVKDSFFLDGRLFGTWYKKENMSLCCRKKSCLDKTFCLSLLSLFYTLTFQIVWKHLLPSVMSGDACRAQYCILGPHFYQPGKSKRNVTSMWLGGPREKEGAQIFSSWHSISLKTWRYRKNIAFDSGL